MKKLLLVLATVTVMFVYTASATLASTVYLEGMADGEWKDDTLGFIPYAGDVSGFLVGFSSEINSFVYGCEYVSGDWDSDGTPNDYDSLFIKGGYRIYHGDTTSIAVTLGYYDQDILRYYNFDGFMIGADVDFNFSDKTSLELSMAMSINGNVLMSDTNNADISNYKIKFNYLFTDNFGASLGYRTYISEVKILYGPEYTMSSLTAGIFYKF